MIKNACLDPNYAFCIIIKLSFNESESILTGRCVDISMIGPDGLKFLSHEKIDKNNYLMPVYSYSTKVMFFHCNSEIYPLKYSEKSLLKFALGQPLL